MKDGKRLEIRGGVLGYAPDDASYGTRRFKAARPGRLANGFGALMMNSPRAEVRQDFRGLVSHARHAARNNDYLKSYEGMTRRHGVGPNGFSLQMTAKGAEGKLDKSGNAAFEAAWKRWGERGNCTTCGRMNWHQVEKVAATMLGREGNFLLRKWVGRQFGPFGFQVQPLSIDLLDVDMVQSLANGAYIDGGIEFSELGRPLAFHMFDGHPAEPHTGRGQTRLRIPANQIIHVLRHTETGQALGFPESHTALRRFNMLGKYEESALAAAHWGAANMVFISQEMDGTPTPAPDDDEEGAETPQEMEAGQIVELPPGYKATATPSNYPDANMPGFLKSLTHGGAAGLGVSHAGLTTDVKDASFASLKDARGEEREEWKMWHGDLSDGLHNEVFKSWAPMALLSGQVTLPDGKMIPASRTAKFERAATWRGRGWASMNPKDDAVANEKDLANRLVAPSDIAAGRGEDFEQLAERFARDIETLEAARPGLAQALLSAKPAQPNDPGKPDPDQDPGDTPPDPDQG